MAGETNLNGSPIATRTELRIFSTDGSGTATVDAADFDVLRYTAGALSIDSGGVAGLTSSGALTLDGTSIPLKVATVLKMTVTPATANLINAASGTSLALQYNGTSRIKYDATGIGFFAATPVAKPTVTGSKGANDALASLMTALVALGLCVDSTS